MLRTTISRIRKVCSVGYIPRLLRGDQSNSAVSSAGIRKAHDTTKSTDDGEQATMKKNIDAPAFTLSSEAEFKIGDKFKKKIGEALSLDKIATDNKQPIVTAGLPLTQREICQRIIDQAFGKADDKQPDRALNEQYLSSTVNLEDTRRKIHESEKAKMKLQEQKIHIDNPLLPDDSTEYGIFKMSRELILNEDNQDEILIIDSAPATEPDLTKNSENVKETAEETPAVEEPYIPPSKEDLDKCINNLESIEKKALCDDDAETMEMVKGERKSDPYEKATPTCQPSALKVLNATTAKQDEELLTQKLETIEETPIVEAQKPKLEGFNVTPRVLGNEPTLNSKILEKNRNNSPKVFLPDTLEEVSKRCLNCPLGQIDEMLINEMEKLGMTFKTAQKSPSTPTKDDLVKMDALNKLANSTTEEKDIHSERPELDDNENETATDSRIPDKNEQAEVLKTSEEIVKPAKEAHDILYPNHNRVKLNPVSCMSKKYNPTDDYNGATKFSCRYLPEAAELYKQKIEGTVPNSRALNKPFSLDGSFNSRNLAAEYECGHNQNSSASKNISEYQTLPKKTDEVENHGTTPIRQSTSEMQRELAATVNYLSKVPSTNCSLPGEKWNKEIEHLPTVDKTAQQCSNKLYSTERFEPKPEQDSEKVSLPEDLLNQHWLEPCYGLTCNETCPISPGSTMSDCQNSDFVDITETLYMNKNICESLRPKPQPIMECKNMSSDTQAHLNNMELKPEDLPEIKSTSILEMKSTSMPEIKCTSVPNATGSMPKLDEQVAEVALSELLRRVRETNRLMYSEAKSGLDVQAVGKCGKKAPRCHPMAPRSPPNNPVPPPRFGLPMLKRMPPACKPKRKPSNKCSCAANDGDFFTEMPYELNEAEVSAVRSKVNLTDGVTDRLQNLGKILGGVLRWTKPGIETLLVRDHEPWTPIPSWKTPPKVQKKKWRPALRGEPPCVDGCPDFPKARAGMDQDPPCNLNPCEGFPKRRSFSKLDCFTVSLGEKKVYDLE